MGKMMMRMKMWKPTGMALAAIAATAAVAFAIPSAMAQRDPAYAAARAAGAACARPRPAGRVARGTDEPSSVNANKDQRTDRIGCNWESN